jgi:hypothetical protein
MYTYWLDPSPEARDNRVSNVSVGDTPLLESSGIVEGTVLEEVTVSA